MTDDWHQALALVARGATDVGRRREQNEDAVLLRPDLGLYVVADGAGGHNAGDVASALAITSVKNYFEATARATRQAPSVDRFGLRSGARRLATAVQKANRDVFEISRASKEHRGMGSTVVAIASDHQDPVLHLAHVGDSRCYRSRGGHLDLLTHDHSLLNDVISLKPDMPDSALARLPRKVVTRALGMEDTVRVTVRTVQVAAGDEYLLCSDGLSGEVTDAEIARVLGGGEDPERLVERLIAMANSAGGGDNIAALVLRCTSASSAWSSAPIGDHENDAPPETSDGSCPEIFLLGIEMVDLGSPSRAARPNDAVPSLTEALGTFVGRKSTAARMDRPCVTCGATVQADLTFCPECGVRAG